MDGEEEEVQAGQKPMPVPGAQGGKSTVSPRDGVRRGEGEGHHRKRQLKGRAGKVWERPPPSDSAPELVLLNMDPRGASHVQPVGISGGDPCRLLYLQSVVLSQGGVGEEGELGTRSVQARVLCSEGSAHRGRTPEGPRPCAVRVCCFSSHRNVSPEKICASEE